MKETIRQLTIIFLADIAVFAVLFTCFCAGWDKGGG